MYRTIAIIALLCAVLTTGRAQNTPKRVFNSSVGARRNADSTLSAHVNVGLVGLVDTLRGVQLSLTDAVVRRQGKGVNIGTLAAISAGRFSGTQLSMLTNISLGPFSGLQVSPLTNISMGLKGGLQLSGVANISSATARGAQVAVYNYADTLNGSQIGIINVARSHPKGWQIGVINYTQDTVAHKLGLVNINPKTRIDFLTFIGNTSKLNGAIRFRNKSTYSILGIGTHYMGLDKHFSGALFYRIGQYFNLTPRLSVSGDVGYYHIETFEENTQEKPQRLYSLQAHLNGDYQLTPFLGIFASAGYGSTHYYYHNTKYRNRFILQLGLSFRYNNKRQPGTFYKTAHKADMLSEPTDSLERTYAFLAPWNRKPHYWMAALQVTGINVLVHSFDHFIMKEDFAQVHFKDIGNNFRHAFVWDNDKFSTNLFAHPYHGNLYFNSARSNNLSFWQATPYALAGSAMWEFFGETEPPAINDLMATTFGGICIGEITHRLSALLLDDRKHGAPRFWRELGAGIINPMGAFNRLVRGDAFTVRNDYYRYHDKNRFPVHLAATAGFRYLADDGGLFRGESNPFINVRLAYGDAFDQENNKPYDYFTINMNVGLSFNQPLIYGAHLMGRLWSAPVYMGEKIQTAFGIYQHFNFYDSKPVKNGTSLTPYRISEAASAGPGLVIRYPGLGNISEVEQDVYINGILLGGTKSDYYNVIDRDYNMGSGYSLKTKTIMVFPKLGMFNFTTDYYRLYTWKGYEGKDLANINPLYLNAQGDKGNAELLVLNMSMAFRLKGNLSINMAGSYYMRTTRYSAHPTVYANTFETSLGLSYAL